MYLQGGEGGNTHDMGTYWLQPDSKNISVFIGVVYVWVLACVYLVSFLSFPDEQQPTHMRTFLKLNCITCSVHKANIHKPIFLCARVITSAHLWCTFASSSLWQCTFISFIDTNAHCCIFTSLLHTPIHTLAPRATQNDMRQVPAAWFPLLIHTLAQR